MVGMALAHAIAHQNVYIPGRYFLAGLPAVAFLLVEGWRMLIPVRFKRVAWKTLGAGTVDDPLSIFYGDTIELIGYQRPAPVVPGQDFQI